MRILTPQSRKFAAATVSAFVAFSLVACSSSTAPTPATSETATTAASDQAEVKEVTVVTHDSFNVPEDVMADFTKDTGYKLTLVKKGDAGAMLNQLILTKSNPLGDAFFGVDNSFASRALDEDVVADSGLEDLPQGVEALSPAAKKLIPIDQGDVCVNVDLKYFNDKGIETPKTLDDLANPKYKDMFVTENPASSSPGLSFILATIGKYGEDGWLDYWQKLKANGVKIEKGWTTAYNDTFTAGESGTGKYPIVTSYSSSPSYSIDKETGKPRTASLPDTCFRQVEYAGVLNNAKNPEGAKAFISWLLSKKVQDTIPSNMYMYPVNPESLPAADELKWDALNDNGIKLDPQLIGQKRQEWLETFNQKIIG